jgi:hypothetical protein
MRLVWALVVWAAVFAVLTVWAAPTVRPDGWFDWTPAQLRAHATQCADLKNPTQPVTVRCGAVPVAPYSAARCGWLPRAPRAGALWWCRRY